MKTIALMSRLALRNNSMPNKTVVQVFRFEVILMQQFESVKRLSEMLAGKATSKHNLNNVCSEYSTSFMRI